MKPIAFVIPWYGEDIPGGAEAACRSLVKRLYNYGCKVEVLTTCVKEFSSDWNVNYYKEDIYNTNNITIRRFCVRQRNTKAFDAVNSKLMNKEPITHEEEKVFFNEMVYSPNLNKYIGNNIDNYQCFVFIPYMFGTTFWGIEKYGFNSVLIPCLHDESYAYMDLVKKMFQNTKGIVYLAKPEYELAQRLYNLKDIKTAVLGIGIDTAYLSPVKANHFKEKYNIKEDFILYAGRKDKGKNVDQLIDFFIKYKEIRKNNYKLVLIGGGTIDIPPVFKDYIIDLGFVSNQDKYDAYAAASLLCNPSPNESFSIVIMESWLAETPVLVNSRCAVTKNFCKESKGGLFYSNFEEFLECIDLLIYDKKLSSNMGTNGKSYVIENFSWDVVVKKYIEFFKSL